MVKICHMTSGHDSDDVRIFYRECTSLAAGGYDTYLVARGENREQNGVHVLGVGEAPESRLKRITEFAKKIYLKALEVDADIYHFHDPELLPYGLKLKKRGKKVIFDSHENTMYMLLDKKFIPEPIRPAVSSVYKHRVSHISKQLDSIITVTPHIAETFEKVNPNTWIVTNYPALTGIEEMPEEKFSRFTVCYTGGIDAQWSHHIAIPVLSQCGAEYVMCGSGSEDYLEYIKTLPDWDKVDFRGKVPVSEARKVQKKSHVGFALLQPSRNTGFKTGTLGNTKLFEYMMAGIPFICTDFELWKDIVDKYNCGICVDPNNAAAIADALNFLKNNPEKAVEMGKNGRRAVENEFNWGTQEKKLLELYAELTR